ncbi:MAG: hypothetical protein K9K66_17460 [Desulfarculaceae bacterium]|nr:hypothetical protein [Desulfarculaceae bacterium]MCF8072545.1 hypothetical protein [Desulfarculaceae bacterium]MCF8103448.1 hypothetical protein [Desulfarculaceae bacterium]MCF8117086.1 hypothetical protein [Desulfarculaceae bacterium]
MRISKVMLFGLMAMAALALALGGCATMEKADAKLKKELAKPAPVKPGPCAIQGKLVRAIAPEAKLVGLTCMHKNFDGVMSLAVKVSLKNVSKEPQRYRVNIFLANDKAVGGLIPRKTKKGLVKPGATASFTYFFKGQEKTPLGMTLIVKVMSK